MATPSSRFPTALVYALVGMAVLASVQYRPQAAGPISGRVFEDFNGNGVYDTTTSFVNDGGIGVTPAAIDRGRPGVEVRAFNSAGAQSGPTATTDAAGLYSIATVGAGPYRVEFTNLPAGYQPSAAAPGATGNGTTVQFVPDGNVANINLGILDPANYCQNNPTLMTSCFVFANNVTGPFNANPVLVSFPYSAGSNSPTNAASYFLPNTHAVMVPANQAGSVYGLGYRQGTNTIYSAAFMKKHAGYGPNGTGAIYATNATTGATTLFADLNAIFGANTAGPNAHDPGNNYTRDNDNIAWDAVGKTGLGGLEVSPDGSRVYVVNLFDRRVYDLPTSGPLTTATIRRVSIPLNAPGATGVGGADLRPFGLQWYRGQLYVGVVNSAEATQNRADLRAYIYRLDPTTFTFGAAPALQFPLNYPRGLVFTLQAGGQGEWLPWSPTFRTNSPGTQWGPLGIYPQPMLSSFSFDVDGNLTIGMRDRAGDQFGFFAQDEPGTNTLYEGMSGGDTLLAAANTPGNVSNGWTLESNSVALGFGPTLGQNTNEGPGGGEFFYHESFTFPATNTLLHDELSSGSVFQIPGSPDVVSTAFDAGLTTRTGGFLWFNKTTANETKGYDLYLTQQTVGDSFSKGNGLGEIVAVCTAAPIEIGNRVWIDTDGDGVQDPNELGLDGVTVQLVAPDGTTVLGTATTANGGQYYFSSAVTGTVPNGVYNVTGLTPNTAGYTLRIALNQPVLGGRVPTTPNADATTNGDSRDSDGITTAGNSVITFTTGAAGSNNHTYDFGFVTVSLALGDLVWYDTNDNGIVDAGEQPIGGVDVVLYRDNGDGVFNQAVDTQVAVTTTSATGIYGFTQLAAGDYFVLIPQSELTAGGTLAGYQNSTGQTPGDNANNRDHGVPTPVAGQGIVSELVTLSHNSEPVNDGDTDPNTNLTIDFGFYRLSLGNFVFLDNDNSGAFNGGDVARDGVAVELLNGAGTVVLQTTVTAGGGLYNFTGLTTGDYRVRITPPAGYTSSTGGGSEPAPDPDNNVDNDDNGTTTGATITSLPITLTPGAEPVVTNATGSTDNPTVDFGLIIPAQPQKVSLGNLVWLDYNNSGKVDAGEPGIDNVTVRLLDGAGTTVLGTQSTSGGGFYLFTNLDPGTYRVEVVAPSFTYVNPSTGRLHTCCTSSDAAGYEPAPSPDTDIDNDDNGTTTGAVVRSSIVTLTVGGEPVNDGDVNPNSNLTVDFGFYGNPVPPDVPDPCISLPVPAFTQPNGLIGPFRIGTINQGPDVTSGPLIIDGPIPPGTTFVSATPSNNRGAGVCTVNAGVLECTWAGPNQPGRQEWVDVTLQTTGAVQHGDTVPLWFMANGALPGGSCMFDAAVFVVNGGPTTDLVLTANATAPASSGTTVVAAPGTPVQTTFTVRNAGSLPADGRYAIMVNVPTELAATAFSVNQGNVIPTGPGMGYYDTGTIAPGASAVLNLTFVPQTPGAARIDFIRVSGAPADPDARNDRAAITVDAIGGARSLAIGNVNGVAGGELVTAAGQGELPQVRVFNGSGEELSTPFFAFARTFRGGVRVATCDINADGTDELVVAQGPGGGRVRVLSLVGGLQVEQVAFDAFEAGFTGGVNVSCADTNGDGRAEVVVGPDGGRAPDVRIYSISGGTATLAASFQAYEPGFTGGVRVAAAAFPGSGLLGNFHVATMPGPGRAGEVRVWRRSGASASLLAQATVYASTAGSQVAMGDADGDGTLDLLLAPDGGSPRLLQIFSLGSGALLFDAPSGSGGLNSVRVATGSLLDGVGTSRNTTAAAGGPGDPPVVVLFQLTGGGGIYLRTVNAGEVP